MKKLLFLLGIFLSFHADAQYKYYQDSTYSTPFSLLSSPISVNNGVFWDDDDFVVPIGFYFRFFKDSVNQMTITGNGAFVSSTPNPLNAPNFSAIIVHGSDLIDRDTSENGSFSPISYTTTGVAPNRITKIEWKNAGFFNAIDNGNYLDSIDFQLWLYETKDAIEVHYGNSNLVSSNTDLYDDGPGAWFGIFDSLDINSPNLNCRIAYNLSGSTTNPQLDSATNLNFAVIPGVNGNPQSGRVYRLTPKPKPMGGGGVGYDIITTYENYNIDYFQNSTELRIDIFNNDLYGFQLTDLNGRIIEKGTISKGRKLIRTENLSKGIYFVKLFSKTDNTSFKFVK